MEELISIKDLCVEYRTGADIAKAVNHLDLTINKGEAVGLVGESGAGKTTAALSVLRLLPAKIGFVTQGDILFHGESLFARSKKEMASIRGDKIAMVFANPLTSLNPVFSVGHQIELVFRQHRKISHIEAKKKTEELLEQVGIASFRYKDYPHEFSGGMRQRVGIAAALACSPELLIADEPTTALDVTIQAQILELMKELQKEYSTSLLMITHNLGIIAEMCQKVAVMYAGEIVEFGTVEEVYTNPKHWYTYGLLNAIPKLAGPRERLISIPGSVANARHLSGGCYFHERCGNCSEECESRHPEMVKVSENHWVRCWKARDN